MIINYFKKMKRMKGLWETREKLMVENAKLANSIIGKQKELIEVLRKHIDDYARIVKRLELTGGDK